MSASRRRKPKLAEWRGIKAPRIETCPNVGVSIFMAGDINQARQVCREFCRDVGLCIRLSPADYIYTGGEEAGFVVDLINYARFPKSGIEIQETAARLAEKLRIRLCQQSFTIETGAQSAWVSHRTESASAPK